MTLSQTQVDILQFFLTSTKENYLEKRKKKRRRLKTLSFIKIYLPLAKLLYLKKHTQNTQKSSLKFSFYLHDLYQYHTKYLRRDEDPKQLIK